MTTPANRRNEPRSRPRPLRDLQRRRVRRSRRRHRRPNLSRVSRDGGRRSAFDQPLDSAGFEEPSDILDLTEVDGGACAEVEPAPSATSGPPPQFRKIEGHSDVSFDEAEKIRCGPSRHQGRASRAARGTRSAAFERDERCGRLRFQHAGADRAGAERAHARGLGARDAAATAEDLAGRQSARYGRTPGPRRDRARGARAVAGFPIPLVRP